MTLPQESLLTHQKMIDIQRMSEEKSPNIHKIIHKIIQKNWPSMLSMPSWHCQVLSPGSFSFLSSARLGRPPPKPPTLMVLSTILLDDFLVFFHVGSISWQWMWHFKIWSWVFGDKENRTHKDRKRDTKTFVYTEYYMCMYMYIYIILINELSQILYSLQYSESTVVDVPKSAGSPRPPYRSSHSTSPTSSITGLHSRGLQARGWPAGDQDGDRTATQKWWVFSGKPWKNTGKTLKKLVYHGFKPHIFRKISCITPKTRKTTLCLEPCNSHSPWSPVYGRLTVAKKMMEK